MGKRSLPVAKAETHGALRQPMPSGRKRVTAKGDYGRNA